MESLLVSNGEREKGLSKPHFLTSFTTRIRALFIIALALSASGDVTSAYDPNAGNQPTHLITSDPDLARAVREQLKTEGLLSQKTIGAYLQRGVFRMTSGQGVVEVDFNPSTPSRVRNPDRLIDKTTGDTIIDYVTIANRQDYGELLRITELSEHRGEAGAFYFRTAAGEFISALEGFSLLQTLAFCKDRFGGNYAIPFYRLFHQAGLVPIAKRSKNRCPGPVMILVLRQSDGTLWEVEVANKNCDTSPDIEDYARVLQNPDFLEPDTF